MATELVSVRVTVTDQRGRAIEGLSKDDFKVYEDKVEQPVSFFSDEDTPASIGVVFDTSSSMIGDKIMRAREALARFIRTSHEQLAPLRPLKIGRKESRSHSRTSPG